jgi:uncharacterized repeat protein (TIGR03803 family)
MVGMRNLRAITCGLLTALVFACAAGCTAKAQTMRVLYTFQGQSDGAYPQGALITGGNGYLYGTTSGGGDETCKPEKYVKGCGTIFKLSRRGELTTLYAFHGGNDGAWPRARLLDESGTLYGTTEFGGGGPCYVFYKRRPSGCGTVFKLASDGTETVLHALQGGTDGRFPVIGLTADKAGTPYGVINLLEPDGKGDYIYTIAPNDTMSRVFTFAALEQGSGPNGLTFHHGAFYGTTVGGGTQDGGTAFRLRLDGNESVLASFENPYDNPYDISLPSSAPVFDQGGNLYSASLGGGGAGCGGQGCGTIFKLSSDGIATVLYAFSGEGDGAFPASNLAIDKSGNLYGTTIAGGIGWQNCAPNAKRRTNFNRGSSACGYGVIFKISPDGTYTLLHAFAAGADGSEAGGLLLDGKGNLYGITSDGGIGAGTIFELTP